MSVNFHIRTENEKFPSIYQIISKDKKVCRKIPVYGGKNITGLLTEKCPAYD